MAWKLQFNQLQTLDSATYVVLSREERFVNEIHDHRQELRSSNELLAKLHESGRYEQRKVTRGHKETWAAPSTKEAGASPVILTPRASLFIKRIIPTNEKKWAIIRAHSRHGGDLAVSVSKMVTTMLRHHDQDERQRDGSMHWFPSYSVTFSWYSKKSRIDEKHTYSLRFEKSTFITEEVSLFWGVE